MRILLRGRLFICSAVASAGDGRGGQPLPCAIRHDKGMAKGVVEERRRTTTWEDVVLIYGTEIMSEFSSRYYSCPVLFLSPTTTSISDSTYVHISKYVARSSADRQAYE